MSFSQSSVSISAVSLISLLCITTASCAKKHSRGRPDEVRITAGSQTGGTQPQAGAEQPLGGIGGNAESTGGISDNTGGTNTGGTSGNDKIGGTGGEPMDEPVAGDAGGNAGDGGIIFFPEGGSGGEGNVSGMMGVEPVGGNGGDVNVAGGSQNEGGQNEGGQGGNTGNAGGIIIPEPEPRELRYAPTPWPMSPELGLQTLTDFETCGNVPFVDLQPMFEEVIDVRMDCAPDGQDCEANHWVYKGPISFVNKTYAFAWTAERAGKYRFQISSPNYWNDVHYVSVSQDCAERVSFVGENETPLDYPPFTAHVADAWVTLEPNQTAYVFLQTIAERRTLDVPMLLQVLRQVEAEPPALDEVLVSRVSSLLSVQIRGNDPNADAMHMDVQLLRESEGTPVPLFVDENGQWLEENDEYYWNPTEDPREDRRKITTINTWGARSFVGFDNFSFPSFFNADEISHVRVRVCDFDSLCSNIIETEIENMVAEAPNEVCLSDFNCHEGQVCRYLEDVEAEGEGSPYRCTDVVPSEITEVIAYRTDDSIMLSMQAESLNRDMTLFAVELIDAQDQVVLFKGYGPTLETNRFEMLNVAMESQTHFERQVQIPFTEIGTSNVERVRVWGTRYDFRQFQILASQIRNTEPVEVNVQDMPLTQFGEDCDRTGVLSQCEIGTVCASGRPEEGFTCQQAFTPSIESASGELFEDNRQMQLDLLVLGDVIGYRLRGVGDISESQVSYVDRIENVGEQKHAFVVRRLPQNIVVNDRPEQIEVQVIHRNGYSSEWFEAELEFVPEEPDCQDTGCEDGLYCVRDNETRDYFCEPLPVFERGSCHYNPKTFGLNMHVEGRFEGQSIDLTRNPHVYLLDDNGFIQMGLSAPIADSISLEMDPLDETRFSLDVTYEFRVSPLGKQQSVHYDSVSQVQLTYFLPFNLRSIERVPEDEISAFQMPFEAVPSREENENCDPQLLEDYCEGALQCVESAEGPRCEAPESAFCNPGALNVDLNQFQDPERENRWSVSEMPIRESNSTAFGSCSDETASTARVVQIFRFTPPFEADYFFEHTADYGRESGPRMWIRRQCHIPESEIACSAKDHGVHVFELDFTRAANAIVHLNPEDGPVYIFASHSGQEINIGSYNLSVEQYVSPTILEPGPDEGQSETTAAFFNRETGAIEFSIDTNDLGSASNLREIHLAYQALDENSTPIEFQGDPNNPDDNQDVWEIEHFYLGHSGSQENLGEYRFLVSHLPLSEEQIQEVNQFRVWLRAGQTQSNIITLTPRDSVIREAGGSCDFYGLMSRCLEGLICGRRECGQVSATRYSWSSGLNQFQQSSGTTFCLDDVNPSCPRKICEEGWLLQELNPVQEQSNQWEIRNVFSAQDPNANLYPLRAGCEREEGWVRERAEGGWVFQSGTTHTYPFTAEIPGRYRFQFSTDTSLKKAHHYSVDHSANFDWLALVVRDQCMLSASELGCIRRTQYTGDARGVTLDLSENQTVYIHVSHDDPELVTPWPYTLQVERVR